MDNLFLHHSGVEYPIICGPMYPCSNPELVAAVSNAGALGVIQPIALTYVHGYEFAAGIDYIRSLTQQPLAMNLLIEKGSKKYHQKMQQWLDIALQKNIHFFITSLGKPDWVVERVHQAGGIVYHDVTEAHWAQKAVDVGVDGLIAVNNRAGGHVGSQPFNELLIDLKKFDLPVVCAGGIANKQSYQAAMDAGYQAVQMGTRFIASEECSASNTYKQAIINAHESDIVLTERMTGVAVSIINTPAIQKQGLKPNFLEAWMLKHKKLKYLMRTFMAIKSLQAFKSSHLSKGETKALWQAGKSVDAIDSIEPVNNIIQKFIQSS